MIDNGLARLARALNEQAEPERCRWPLGTCAYPAVVDGLCGFHKGRELHDRDTALAARVARAEPPREGQTRYTRQGRKR